MGNFKEKRSHNGIEKKENFIVIVIASFMRIFIVNKSKGWCFYTGTHSPTTSSELTPSAYKAEAVQVCC